MWNSGEIRWHVKGVLIVVRFQTTVIRRGLQKKEKTQQSLVTPAPATLKGSQGSRPMTPYPTAPGVVDIAWWTTEFKEERKTGRGVLLWGRRRYREWKRSRSKLKISPKVVTPAGSTVKRCNGYRICSVTQVMFSHTHTHFCQRKDTLFTASYRKILTHARDHALIYDQGANTHRERLHSDGWRKSASGAFEKWNIVNKIKACALWTGERSIMLLIRDLCFPW